MIHFGVTNTIVIKNSTFKGVDSGVIPGWVIRWEAPRKKNQWLWKDEGVTLIPTQMKGKKSSKIVRSNPTAQNLMICRQIFRIALYALELSLCKQWVLFSHLQIMLPHLHCLLVEIDADDLHNQSMMCSRLMYFIRGLFTLLKIFKVLYQKTCEDVIVDMHIRLADEVSVQT